MKTDRSELYHREKRLAYLMLLPTFLLVILLVIIPLLANFWISFKPIELGDLRPPKLVLKEYLRKVKNIGDTGTLEYRYRNSSVKFNLKEVVFTDEVPIGLTIIESVELCKLPNNNQIKCDLGDLPPRKSGKLKFKVLANENWNESLSNPRSTLQTVNYVSTNILTSFDFTFKNYSKVFSATEFWNVLKVSILYTVFGTAGAMILGLFAAQILQKSFPTRPLIRGLLLFPYVAPVIAVAFSWLVLFNPFSGAINALLIQMGISDQPVNFFGQRNIEIGFFGISFSFPLALTMVILFEIWRYFPLSFLFILARMQSISSEIYEAAEMDGASPIQQFRFLSLPHIAGILAVLFLLRFIWTFNKFDDIFLLTGGNAGTRTLTVNVYEQAFAISNLGAGSAVAVVIFGFLLLFSIVFIRFSPRDNDQ